MRFYHLKIAWILLFFGSEQYHHNTVSVSLSITAFDVKMCCIFIRVQLKSSFPINM